MEKITIPVTFEAGTIAEIGYGGLKVTWLESEKDGTEFALTSGAGVGSPLLEASARNGTLCACAKADITPLAQQLFGALEQELKRQGATGQPPA